MSGSPELPKLGTGNSRLTCDAMVGSDGDDFLKVCCDIVSTDYLRTQ
jgi:hypothetical protein